MSRTIRRSLAVVTLVLAGAACGDSDDTATTTNTSTTTSEDTTTTSEATTTTEAAAETPGYTVTVEDPGSEPRRELRLAVEAGDVDRLTQRQENSLEISAGGQVQSSPSPSTEIDLSYTVDEATADRIVATGTYDDVRVLESPGDDPAVVSQLRELLDGFRGVTTRTAYTPRGEILEARFDDLQLSGPAGPLLEQFASSFTDAVMSLSTPFPEEAVGVGARWRIDTDTEIAGLPVTIATTIQLTEVTEDRALGTIDQTLTFIPGEVETLGVTATIISGELAGGGDIEWDLAGGIVPRSDITTSGTTVMEANGQRIEQRQEQRIVFTAR